MSALRGRIVLVAEDECFLATEIARRLKKAGAEVIGPFPSVGAAHAAIEGERRPDMAMLDIDLRGEMVHPLVDLLGRRGMPFIFVTGCGRSAIPTAHQGVPICDMPADVADFARELAATLDLP